MRDTHLLPVLPSKGPTSSARGCFYFDPESNDPTMGPATTKTTHTTTNETATKKRGQMISPHGHPGPAAARPRAVRRGRRDCSAHVGRGSADRQHHELGGQGGHLELLQLGSCAAAPSPRMFIVFSGALLLGNLGNALVTMHVQNSMNPWILGDIYK